MKKINIVFILLISILSVFEAKAQNPTSILDVQINIVDINSELTDPMLIDESIMEVDPMILNDPAMLDNPEIIEYKTEQLMNQNRVMKNISIVLILSDTIDIHKIHYQVGRATGIYDIANGNINLNQPQQNSPINFHQTLNQIIINLGSYENTDNVFSSFYLENIHGGNSEVVNKETHL